MLDPDTFQPISLDEFLSRVGDTLINSAELDAAYNLVQESITEEKISENRVESRSYSEAWWQIKREKIIEIVRPYWTVGSRQDLSLYLADFLGRKGITVTDVEQLILEIASLCGDDETPQRMGAIKSTYEKQAKGEKTNYKGMKEILSAADFERLAGLFANKEGANVEEDRAEYHGMADKEMLPQCEFPFDVFPSEFRMFVEIVADALGVEREIVACTALCFISGAIGNTIRVSPKYGHEVALFLWLIIVAASGYGKSPVEHALIRPIKAMQAEKHKDYKRALKEFKQLLREAKRDLTIEVPDEPQVEHLFFSDVTVEALGKGFESTPRGTICYQDELAGLILGLNQYKSGGGNDLQHYLELFDCQFWKIDRKNETRLVLNTGAAITGGIQPQVMPMVFTQQSFHNGFLPRFLLVHAENKTLRYSRRGLDSKDTSYWESLLKRCYDIP
jgi:uncharacterized protein DUF3987